MTNNLGSLHSVVLHWDSCCPQIACLNKAMAATNPLSFFLLEYHVHLWKKHFHA